MSSDSTINSIVNDAIKVEQRSQWFGIVNDPDLAIKLANAPAQLGTTKRLAEYRTTLHFRPEFLQKKDCGLPLVPLTLLRFVEWFCAANKRRAQIKIHAFLNHLGVWNQMANTPSFTGRILLALILMVGFYLFAIAIALGLFLIPVAEVLATNQIHPKIAIICVIVGCMILWSIMPRLDRLVAPGPLITETDQPELFAQIKSVAEATNQPMPRAVYAVPEMNAWVANRGGIMGIGSSRIMGLGVPLMQALTTQEFRGVLAHEFGHYDAGDTKLGPWIYVTRAAIIRTVINLAQQGSSIIRKPFEWYLQMFLYLTQKVSRHQEFNADALAAKIVGPEAMSSGLKNVHSNAVAFDSYWQNEYIPVLSSGFRAPLLQGFQVFCSGEKLQHALGELIDEELKAGKADIYDSHPALKERLAAIQSIVGPALPALDPPFIENLRNLDELEGKMIAHLAKQAKVANPESISWESVAEKVWLPYWKQTCERFGRQTEDLSLKRATEILGSAEGIPNLLATAILKQVQASHEQAEIAFNLIPTALVLALHREGWSISTPLGSPVVAQLHGRTLEPFALFDKLQKKEISISGLFDEFQKVGIEGLMLWGTGSADATKNPIPPFAPEKFQEHQAADSTWSEAVATPDTQELQEDRQPSADTPSVTGGSKQPDHATKEKNSWWSFIGFAGLSLLFLAIIVAKFSRRFLTTPDDQQKKYLQPSEVVAQRQVEAIPFDTEKWNKSLEDQRLAKQKSEEERIRKEEDDRLRVEMKKKQDALDREEDAIREQRRIEAEKQRREESLQFTLRENYYSRLERLGNAAVLARRLPTQPLFVSGSLDDHRLSWRVHILPLMRDVELFTLYKKFRLDEPWDSEHNRELIAQIPEIFKGKDVSDGKTCIRTPWILDGPYDQRTKNCEILDELWATALFVRVGPSKAVPWTMPDAEMPLNAREVADLDLPADRFQFVPLSKNKEMGGFLNTSLGQISNERIIQAILTPSGGEVVHFRESPKSIDIAKTNIDASLELRDRADELPQAEDKMQKILEGLRKMQSGSTEKGGAKSRLSWRVHLLPWIGEEALYAKFRLNEPWNSENNLNLLDQMPNVFSGGSGPVKTRFLGQTGPLEQYLHGEKADASNYVAILYFTSIRNARPWTMPDDPSLEKPYFFHLNGWTTEGESLIGLANGQTQRVPSNLHPTKWKVLLGTDGSQIELPNLLKEPDSPLVASKTPTSALPIDVKPLLGKFPRIKNPVPRNEELRTKMLAIARALPENWDTVSGKMAMFSWRVSTLSRWNATALYTQFQNLTSIPNAQFDKTMPPELSFPEIDPARCPIRRLKLGTRESPGHIFFYSNKPISTPWYEPDDLEYSDTLQYDDLTDAESLPIVIKGEYMEIPKSIPQEALLELLTSSLDAGKDFRGIARQVSYSTGRKLCEAKDEKNWLVERMGLIGQNLRVQSRARKGTIAFPETWSPLSWRVHLLPTLGFEKLYSQFHLDEPWDSPHNKQLLKFMPDIYRGPHDSMNSVTTAIQLVVGKQTLFPYAGVGGVTEDMIDSYSIISILVPKELEVPWTKPQDFDISQFERLDPKFDLVVLTDDLSPRILEAGYSPEVLRQQMTSCGGEEIATKDAPKLKARLPVR